VGPVEEIGEKCMLEENVEVLGVETDKLVLLSDSARSTDDIELEGAFDVTKPKAES
jgi:hypothetical protein